MKHKLHLIIALLFVLAFSAWGAAWVAINLLDTDISRDSFTDSYGIVALLGAAVGLIASRKWGGFRSQFGRAIGFLAIGMGLQFIGQLTYTLYYVLGDVELAFPSVGDIPYLLSNLAYILGVLTLLQVLCYPRKFYKPWWVSVIALIITATVIFAMVQTFLGIAVTDERGAIYQILNAAYPLLQAVYFLFGIIALLQSRLLAGAKMFHAIICLLLALIVQFVADYVFLYSSYYETWQPAGTSDGLYLLAYICMGASILLIDRVRRQAIAPKTVAGAN